MPALTQALAKTSGRKKPYYVFSLFSFLRSLLLPARAQMMWSGRGANNVLCEDGWVAAGKPKGLRVHQHSHASPRNPEGANQTSQFQSFKFLKFLLVVD
jgi:hypothetical protein